MAAQDPTDLESRMLEAEALATSGDTAEASAVLDELATLLPADARSRDGASRSRPGPRHRPPPAPAPTATGGGPSAEDVATAIFTETALSYESNDLFDQQFRGARVTWTGELKSIRAYRYDADFGDEPGVKAVVTIASVQHDLYGNTSIDAVVALPPGSDRGRQRHDTVTITRGAGQGGPADAQHLHRRRHARPERRRLPEPLLAGSS